MAIGRGNGKWALSFDGVNDYVSINFLSSSVSFSAITIEAWAKKEAASGGIILNEQNGDTLWFKIDSTEKFAVYLGDTTDTGKMYINGKLEKTFSTSGTLNFDSTFRIGAREDAVELLNGFIDEVRIYDQALTLGQIRQLYAEGLESHRNLVIK